LWVCVSWYPWGRMVGCLSHLYVARSEGSEQTSSVPTSDMGETTRHQTVCRCPPPYWLLSSMYHEYQVKIFSYLGAGRPLSSLHYHSLGLSQYEKNWKHTPSSSLTTLPVQRESPIRTYCNKSCALRDINILCAKEGVQCFQGYRPSHY